MFQLRKRRILLEKIKMLKASLFFLNNRKKRDYNFPTDGIKVKLVNILEF